MPNPKTSTCSFCGCYHYLLLAFTRFIPIPILTFNRPYTNLSSTTKLVSLEGLLYLGSKCLLVLLLLVLNSVASDLFLWYDSGGQVGKPFLPRVVCLVLQFPVLIFCSIVKDFHYF